jgi:hypothetical protein
MNIRPPGDFGSVRVRFTIGVVLIVLSIAFIVLYNKLPERRELITFAAAVVGGAGTVYSAYFTSASLRLSVQLTRDGNTFDLLKELNTVNVVRIRAKIRQKLPKTELTKTEMGEIISKDQVLLEDVLTLLGYFEDTSIAVKFDHVNERILYASLSFLVPDAYKSLRPFIDFRREKDKDETIFKEFEDLAQAWIAGRSLRTGRKLVTESHGTFVSAR